MGTLNGTATLNQTATYNLTGGHNDWRAWGFSGQDVVSKNITTHIISDLSIYGAQDTSNTSNAQFTWTDGDIITSYSGRGGEYTTSLNSALIFFAGASDTISRTLQVWVGVKNATGKMTAFLGDGSAPTYTDTSFTSTGGTLNDGWYLFVYKGDHVTTLTVNWSLNTINGASPKMFMRAAALTGDPHFMGFDKILFDYQGRGDAYYSLLNDQNINVNAHFQRFDSTTTVVTELGLMTHGTNGLSKVRFTADHQGYTVNGSGTTEEFTMIPYNDPLEAAKLDILPDKFRDDEAPILLGAVEVISYPYNFIISRMELRGIKYLNVHAKISDRYLGIPTGIIGQTVLPAGGRIHNDHFEVGNLFDTHWQHNRFLPGKII